MKLVYFLFAFYFLTLAVYPCGDENTCIDDQKYGFSVAGISNHAHSSSEQDVCSPLCICACCSAQVQLSSLSAPASFIDWAPNTSLMTAYQEHIYIVSSHSIWQPPKL